MDLQAIEMVTDRLAAEFSIRPPKVTYGWVPRSMRLGVRAKIWRRRLRLVIGPASERLEPDELEGEETLDRPARAVLDPVGDGKGRRTRCLQDLTDWFRAR